MLHLYCTVLYSEQSCVGRRAIPARVDFIAGRAAEKVERAEPGRGRFSAGQAGRPKEAAAQFVGFCGKTSVYLRGTAGRFFFKLSPYSCSSLHGTVLTMGPKPLLRGSARKLGLPGTAPVRPGKPQPNRPFKTGPMF